jgi:hypothetical protein
VTRAVTAIDLHILAIDTHLQVVQAVIYL